MVPLSEYPSISANATLFQAAAVLDETRSKYKDKSHLNRALLVCDETGRIVGKLCFMKFLKKFRFSYERWNTQLDKFCQRAAEMCVGSITNTHLDEEIIDADASIYEAIDQLIRGQHQSLLVSTAGNIVGLLTLAEVRMELGRRITASRGQLS